MVGAIKAVARTLRRAGKPAVLGLRLPLLNFLFRHLVRLDDLPRAGVVELQGEKDVGPETGVRITAIASMRHLPHLGVNHQRPGIDPFLRLHRPPIHVEKRLLRHALFLGLGLNDLSGPIHKLIAVAQDVIGRFPFAVAQLEHGNPFAFSARAGHREARRIRGPKRCRCVALVTGEFRGGFVRPRLHELSFLAAEFPLLVRRKPARARRRRRALRKPRCRRPNLHHRGDYCRPNDSHAP